jgi:hypothetical protein
LKNVSAQDETPKTLKDNPLPHPNLKNTKKSRISFPSLALQQKWYIETITFIGCYLNSYTLAAINHL